MELRTSSWESRKDCGFVNAVNTCVKVSANHWWQTVACSFDMLVTETTAFICATSLCRGPLLKLDLLATWGQHNIKQQACPIVFILRCSNIMQYKCSCFMPKQSEICKLHVTDFTFPHFKTGKGTTGMAKRVKWIPCSLTPNVTDVLVI